MHDTLYYLIQKKHWTTEGVHRGSPLDIKDGFIHLSTPRQLPRVAVKFFRGVPAVLLLTLKTTKLEGELEWIQSKSTGGYYAHLHGTIPQDAVIKIEELKTDGEGDLILPESVRELT